ncbi:MAG: flagellar hook capping FlgD N-terminal domain-containing protein [Pseudomonadota bacterium]|nr:flagellar hook capping FlgD N-terminal domain-containing protein [Pseudomonadota bacterium]
MTTPISSQSSDDVYAKLGLNVPQAARKSSLGQADFLRLMTEQMKHQDPLKPMDNKEFLGQLAQFSTVQGIEQMQSAMGSMASVMESDQALRAAALVGRDALVSADAVKIGEGGSLKGSVINGDAGQLRIDVIDASGKIVRSLPMAGEADGDTDWQWDGKNEQGQPVPAGAYKVRAYSGSSALDVQFATRIDSVSIESGGLVLNLSGLGSQPLSSIRRIG